MACLRHTADAVTPGWSDSFRIASFSSTVNFRYDRLSVTDASRSWGMFARSSRDANRQPILDVRLTRKRHTSMSLVERRTYGKLSGVGITYWSARCASAPWPISRRFGPRSIALSPVQNAVPIGDADSRLI